MCTHHLDYVADNGKLHKYCVNCTHCLWIAVDGTCSFPVEAEPSVLPVLEHIGLLYSQITVTCFHQPAIDSFTVSLHRPNRRHLPVIRAVLWGCQWPLKNGGNSHRLRELKFHCGWGNPSCYLDQLITKGWCQSTETHVSVSHSTDSADASMPGVGSSLSQSRPLVVQPHHVTSARLAVCPRLSSCVERGFPYWKI